MSISLIVPLFNEAQRISLEYLRGLGEIQGVSLTLVDDGSTDDTFNLISNPHEPWNVIRLDQNSGKGEAIRLGFLQVLPTIKDKKENGLGEPLAARDVQCIGYLDGDGAFPLPAVVNFLGDVDGLPGRTVYMSSRVKLVDKDIVRSNLRHLLSRVLLTILSMIAANRTMPYDPQSGLKVFEINETLELALQTPFRTRWFFDLERLCRLPSRENGSLVWAEIPINAWREIQGSKVRPGAVVRDCFQIALILRGRGV